MNVTIIHKTSVQDEVLDALAAELPAIISGLLEVPGGKVAILKPGQISLQFSQASPRDIGSDLRVVILARSVGPRTTAENKLAAAILEKVAGTVKKSGHDCSITLRLYLTEIGAAEYFPA